MKFLQLFGTLLVVSRVYALNFACVPVCEVPCWILSDWRNYITSAQAHSIDVFALDITYRDPTAANTVSKAFIAANDLGFHLFFTFKGVWPQSAISGYLDQYGDTSPYLSGGLPLDLDSALHSMPPGWPSLPSSEVAATTLIPWPVPTAACDSHNTSTSTPPSSSPTVSPSKSPALSSIPSPTTSTATLFPITTTSSRGQTTTSFSTQSQSSLNNTSLPPNASVTTLTNTVANGQPTALETLTSITTTNSLGQTTTSFSTQSQSRPNNTSLPPGVSVTTLTNTGAIGQPTTLMETLTPITTTSSLGQTTTSFSTESQSSPNTTSLPPNASVTILTTTGADGQPITLTETLVPITTSNSVGQTTTLLSAEPPSNPTTTPLPSGASITLITTTKPDGSTTVLTDTLVPFTTTNSLGSVITGTSTNGPTITSGTTILPSGDSITFITTTDSSGLTIVLTDTLIPFTTTNSLGSVITGTLTDSPTITSGATTLPSGDSITFITTTDSIGSTTVLTNTLIPFTSTNSQGSLRTGTSTEGSTIPTGGTTTPTAQWGTDIITSTDTSPPPGFSTVVITDSHITANEWSTTTDAQGSTTIVPIVLVSPSVGVIYWNLPPIPDVVFTFPRIPDIVLPCIPIPFLQDCAPDPPQTDGDTSNQNSQEPTSTPTSTPISSCLSTETATDITYYVSFDVDTNGTTTATSTYSTFSTIVEGCSVTPTTGTVSAIATCTSGCCPELTYNDSDTNDDDAPSTGSNSEEVTSVPATPAAKPRLRREPKQTSAATLGSIAGRIWLSSKPRDLALLEKRVGKRGSRIVSSFGICAIDQPFRENPYPRVSDYATYAEASKYFVVTTSAVPPGAVCPPVPTFSSVANIAGQSHRAGGPVYVTVDPKNRLDPLWPYPPGTPWVNSDHVYEFSNLGNFFEAMLTGPSAPSCGSFNTWFSPSRLRNIYGYMPGNMYPDMAAMDAVANADKGKLFDPGSWSFGRRARIYDNIIKYGMAAGLVNTDDFVELFQKTHQRLYEAFMSVDQQINNAPCSGPGAPPADISPTWANAYSTWMTDFLQIQGQAASMTAAAAYAQLALQPAVNTMSLMATYPPNSFLLRSADMATISMPANALPVKRQACSITPTPTPSPSPSTTPTPSPSPTPPTFISCSADGPEPENNINSAYCVCSGSSFAQSFATISGSVNSCAYTALPTATINPVSTPSPSPTPALSLISCSSDGPQPENGINSGYCVCSGSTFAQSVITISGTANSCGFTSLPSQTINPVTSAITATTTSSKSTSTTSTTSAAPTGPTMILEIYVDNYQDEISSQNYWYFFDASSATSGSNAPCDTKASLKVDAPSSIEAGAQAYPSGTFKMKSHGMDCTYTGDGTKIGALSCPGKQTTCESRLQKVECPFISNFRDIMTWEGLCHWF